ncbi:MAG: hypothetical protein EOO74_09380 [Myxococcales bacterium]|nr:MAG: hypothetical protein EOO74_09380 [Myxococcales bacterium]
MLRSFDYAEQVAARSQTQWASAQSRAFLDGYQSATAEFTDQDRLLMRAFEVDKAVYEVTYEARNRPDWIDIPLSAIARTLEASRG